MRWNWKGLSAETGEVAVYVLRREAEEISHDRPNGEGSERTGRRERDGRKKEREREEEDEEEEEEEERLREVVVEVSRASEARRMDLKRIIMMMMMDDDDDG